MELKNSRILVVDDEIINLRLIEKILHSAGYQFVELVSDSREAVERCCKQKSDLILLDINMPYLDGYDVMRNLQALNQELCAPIMVLTAQQSREFRVKALDLGARDFITKPFDQVELLARVRNLLHAFKFEQSLSSRKEQLEHLVRERTQELHDTRLQIVRKLGRAAEFRDNETGNHIIRMSKIAALLGRACGFKEYDCDLLLNSSPMHDIGKIGIPDNILLKKGKLDAEEWEIMKTHTVIGGDILAGDDSDVMQMARSIALTHHEKWDGSGYPKGLVGENIPLVGRITAIADVFDALTSERPYKHAWPVPNAIEYIKENAGNHFDPALVDKFLKLMPEIQQIIEEYSDPSVDMGQSEAMQAH